MAKWQGFCRGVEGTGCHLRVADLQRQSGALVPAGRQLRQAPLAERRELEAAGAQALGPDAGQLLCAVEPEPHLVRPKVAGLQRLRNQRSVLVGVQVS